VNVLNDCKEESSKEKREFIDMSSCGSSRTKHVMASRLLTSLTLRLKHQARISDTIPTEGVAARFGTLRSKIQSSVLVVQR
jgi:hypothetical protein